MAIDDVSVLRIQADVELLIGTNASQMLEPWRVINTHGNGPYGIRTILVWVIKGSHRSDELCGSGYPAATVHRISIKPIEKNQYTHDFNEETSEDKMEMSREDVELMEIALQYMSFS